MADKSAAKTPRIISRIKAASDAFWKPSTVGWGPGEPILPAAAQEPPRREDYQVGRNIIWSPRAEESRAVTYGQMRSISRVYGVLRTVIEKRKDEIKGLEWDISLRPEYVGQVNDPTAEIRKVRRFFEKPDLETPFDQWLNIILEDLYVIDAPTLYKERDRLGRFRSLQNIDGSTFKLLVDDSGRVPDPPQLAYEQIIKGMPRTGYIKPIAGINPYLTSDPVLYTSELRESFTNLEELYYRPYNLASDGVYGYSHVESIIMTVNIALRRDTSFLEWFRTGNVPQGLILAPKEWTAEQITQFQAMFDTLLSGDTAARAKMHMVPGEGVTMINQLQFDAIFDQWLARIICARFNVSPIPYVSQINRAVGEEMEEASRDEGLVPMMNYLKQWFNDVIETCLEKPFLQFRWNPGQNYDKDDSSMDASLQEHGALFIDDLRQKQGKEPLPNGLGAVPLILNGGSWVKVEDVISGKLNQRTPEAPFSNAGDGAVDDGLPRLSIGDDETEEKPFALSIRSELDAWERFAINRLGKKTTRNFETKAIKATLAKTLQSQLVEARTPEAIKIVFEAARQNLGRRRTPRTEDSLSQLMGDYESVLKKAMTEARDKIEVTNESHTR